MRTIDDFDDVIAQPGQNLTELERAVLCGLANGKPPSAISAELHQSAGVIRIAELDARAKLGAKTQAHMIARGFVLGVLLPRALCLLVVLMAAGDLNPGHRTRLPRTGRSGRETAYTLRAPALV